MKLLLTGACGVLGSALLEEGIKANHEISIITKSLHHSSYAFMVRHKINVFFRQDINRLSEILDKQDVIINLDGCSSSSTSDEKERELRNIIQPKHLYESLKSNQHFIHCSTSATLCNGLKDSPSCEKDWGQSRGTPYADSKLFFDQWLKKNERCPTLVIHPGYLLGEWDSRPSSGAIFLKLALGQTDSFVNRPKNFVSAREVALFILNSLNSHLTGRYILGGKNILISDFFKITAKYLDFKMPQQVTGYEFLDQFMLEFCKSGPLDSTVASTIGLKNDQEVEQMIIASLRGLSMRKFIRLKI